MLGLHPQPWYVAAHNVTSCSVAARSGATAAAAAVAAAAACACGSPSLQQQQQQLPKLQQASFTGQQLPHQQLELGQMSEGSSGALSTGVSWHVSSPESPQDTAGPSSTSSGSTGALLAYPAGAFMAPAVRTGNVSPHLGSNAGQAWSPTHPQLQLPEQQQQGQAGGTISNLLQLQATHCSQDPASCSLQDMGQPGTWAVQYAAAGQPVLQPQPQCGMSSGLPCTVACDLHLADQHSFMQQGLFHSTPQQQQQQQQLQLLLAHEQATCPQLLPPLQQAAAAPRQPVLQLPVVLGAAEQQQPVLPVVLDTTQQQQPVLPGVLDTLQQQQQQLQQQQHVLPVVLGATQQQQPVQPVMLAAMQQQQQQQQPRRTLVPMNPVGNAPKAPSKRVSTMLVLGSGPPAGPNDASFEAGFEAGILQGIAQYTQQLNASSILSAGQGGPVTALSAVSAAPAALCGSGGLLVAAESALGLRLYPAVTSCPVLNPTGLGVCPVGASVPSAAAASAGSAAALPGSTSQAASRVLLHAQVAQQQSILQAALQQQQQQQLLQATLQQQLQQQAGALSGLKLKRGSAAKCGRKRRLHDQQPSTSAEYAALLHAAEHAGAARPRAPRAHAEAAAVAHSPAAAAGTATAAAGTATAAAAPGPAPAAAAATTAAADAAAPKLPSAKSLATCCSISGLLGVSSSEQAALRLSNMSRAELYQFAAKALGSSCTSQQLSHTTASAAQHAEPQPGFHSSRSWPAGSVTHHTLQQQGARSCSPSAPASKKVCVSDRSFAAVAPQQAATSNLQSPGRSLPCHAAAAAAAAAEGAATASSVQCASSHTGALQPQAAVQHSTGVAAAARSANASSGNAAAAAVNLEQPLPHMQMHMDWQQDGTEDWPQQI